LAITAEWLNLKRLLRILKSLRDWNVVTRIWDNLGRSVVILPLFSLALFLFVSTLPGYPRLGTPDTGPPGWASWFDLVALFPLTGILSYAIIGVDNRSAPLAWLLTFAPATSSALASYYFFFQPASGYSLPVFTEGLLQLSVYILPIAIAFALSLLLFDRNTSQLSRQAATAKRRLPWIAAACAIALAAAEIVLRFSASKGIEISWVSDIGITLESGARELLSGMNPYTVLLPPWYGPANILYGPVAFAVAAPFSLLPAGAAAHASSGAFALVASFGVWKVMRKLSPQFAELAALLFIALPTTAFTLETGTSLHLLTVAVAIWTFYFYLRGWYASVGLLALIGLLTSVVPGALLVGYLAFSRTRTKGLLFGFCLPLALVVGGALLFFPITFAEGLVVGVWNGLGGWFKGFSINAMLEPGLNKPLVLFALLILFGWFVRESYRASTPARLAIVFGVFLLFLPIALGFFAVYFYVWSSAFIVVGLFSPRGYASVTNRNRPRDAPDVGSRPLRKAEAPFATAGLPLSGQTSDGGLGPLEVVDDLRGRTHLLARSIFDGMKGARRGSSRDPWRAALLLFIQPVIWVKWGIEGIWRSGAPFHPSRFDLLDAAAQQAPMEGLWLEFGVYKGESINHLARLSGRQIVGFDSFDGLPENWTLTLRRGSFSTQGSMPQVESNVLLVKGWFSETLPSFLRTRAHSRISFLHIDCDLYSSAKFVLQSLAEMIDSQTVIVFDEYNTIFPDDEARAFREFLRTSGLSFHYIGCSPGGAVAVRIGDPPVSK
jgi:methyltransferase family protein